MCYWQVSLGYESLPDWTRLNSGSCTFDSFSSLAVCSKCVDISSHIVKSCNNSECQLSLPAGPSIQGHGGQINSSVTNISARLSDIEPSVFQFSSLISKRMNNFDVVVAWECALSYCVNTYSASVTDGIIEQYGMYLSKSVLPFAGNLSGHETNLGARAPAHFLLSL